MIVYIDKKLHTQHAETGTRSHPWTSSISDPNQKYVDFKMYPDRIPEVLEDFQPWNDSVAAQSFFQFLRYVNRPGCHLETNDCAFRGPEADSKRDCPPELCRDRIPSHRSQGRLMFLLREWVANVDEGFSEALLHTFHKSIHAHSCDSKAVIALSFAPVDFPSLEGKPEGRQLVANWWTWGEGEQEALAALTEVVAAFRVAVDAVDTAIELDNTDNEGESSKSDK